MRTAVVLIALAGLARADGHKPLPDKFAVRAAAVFDKAVAAEQANQWRKAIELYEQAFELSPHPNTVFNIATLYADHGEDKRALEAFQLYLDLAPDAPDRAAVDERITAILTKKWTVPLESFRSVDLAESYVLIDGEVIAKPGQIKNDKLDVTYSPGWHWAIAVSPISFGTDAFGSHGDYDDRHEKISLQGDTHGDGNLLVQLDYGIEGDVEGKLLKERVRYKAPAGAHWLKLRDHGHECRPVKLDIPNGEDTLVVLVVPNENVDSDVQRCRTLAIKQQKLVFKSR